MKNQRKSHTDRKIDWSFIDEVIRPVVELLNKYGFKTFESCQGGKGHCFELPTVRFYGSEFDLIRAYELCALYKINVFQANRVFRKTDIYKNINHGESIGRSWDEPFNELTFIPHSKTGTIYLEN